MPTQNQNALCSAILSLFFLAGGIPGPIAFGSVIDLSCLMWQDKCGEQGSCYLYHNSAMSQYTLVAGILYKVLMIHRLTGFLPGIFFTPKCLLTVYDFIVFFL